MIEERVELQRIRDAYARRARSYPPLSAWVHASRQERERSIVTCLRVAGLQSLANLDVLEMGCGSGANLLDLIRLGADPARLVGNDLLEDRLQAARRVLPTSVTLISGDAAVAIPGEGRFDIVYQSMMCSSILDDTLLRGVAAAMWRLVRPGGAIMWYDFVVDNPLNRDVRGMPRSRVRALFPLAQLRFWSVTLAPPIARQVTRVHPALYGCFNLLPFLRTHVLCWIQKPGFEQWSAR